MVGVAGAGGGGGEVDAGQQRAARLVVQTDEQVAGLQAGPRGGLDVLDEESGVVGEADGGAGGAGPGRR